MGHKQNFYLGTHFHYQNITPRKKSQPLSTLKKEIFLNFFEH